MDEGACMKKIEWIKKKINPSKSHRSPLGYQQGIDFLKTNMLSIGYYKVSKISILGHIGSWLGISWKWIIYDDDNHILQDIRYPNLDPG